MAQMGTDREFEDWIARQYRTATANMLLSVSATGFVKHRAGFGQTIVPAKGSVVAAPALAPCDPDPDYFFHWYRDSAVVMDALRLVGTDAARGHFCDFVAFSLGLDRRDGQSPATIPQWRDAVAPDLRRYLRDDGETAVDIRAETRVNPDGSLDILRWSRPQHDGIAARALIVLRWVASRGSFGAEVDQAIARLLGEDLRYVLAHWRMPSFDLWEEELAHHYYTLRLQGAALEQGALWLAGQGDADGADAARADAAEIMRRLDDYWLPQAGYYRSRLGGGAQGTAKHLDIAVILAAIHAGGASAHSPADARAAATLDRLDELFEDEYPINRDRPQGRGPALGRYRGDEYYSGGAYYFSTLAAAEFCFRRACALGPGDIAQGLVARGEAYLATVRAYTPEDGQLAEQFDRTNGAQTSAKHLAWSYAAFISAVWARRAAHACCDQH
jgi:glucoamylase